MKRSKLIPWFSWAVLTLLLGGYFAQVLRNDQSALFLPNRSSHGHHQIEKACNVCHTEPFGGENMLQAACVQCHGEALKAAHDSHPKRLFTDPRNADRVAGIDAKRCVTCHQEHRPGLLRPMDVTIADDNCLHCHGEVAEERPSHVGFSARTCASGGCHNYHDNSALYEDFLVKHLNDPGTLPEATVVGRNLSEVARALAKRPVRSLTHKDQDAPAAHADPKAVAQWAETAHARGGVNCRDCHIEKTSDGGAAVWREKPGVAACRECHEEEVNGFEGGKHGVRLALDLPSMQPRLARQPMKAKARDKELQCNSCHGAHRYDTRKAAVESCLGCHHDEHSRAYKQSPHYRLWQAEVTDRDEPGSGVACATCHLPRETHRQEGLARVRVQHNQSQNLRPNEKMIRSVCLTCHGLGFAIDALADGDLVRRNFNGAPSRHVASVDMAKAREQLQQEKR
jgi:hypothetical protein